MSKGGKLFGGVQCCSFESMRMRRWKLVCCTVLLWCAEGITSCTTVVCAVYEATFCETALAKLAETRKVNVYGVQSSKPLGGRWRITIYHQPARSSHPHPTMTAAAAAASATSGMCSVLPQTTKWTSEVGWRSGMTKKTLALSSTSTTTVPVRRHRSEYQQL